MTIELTEEQHATLEKAADELPLVRDPKTNLAYYLIRAEDYESIREILELEDDHSCLGVAQCGRSYG